MCDISRCDTQRYRHLACGISTSRHLKVTKQSSNSRTRIRWQCCGRASTRSLISFPITGCDRGGGLITVRRNFVIQIPGRVGFESTYMPGHLPMSPLLAALSIWAVDSLSNCLIGGCCCCCCCCCCCGVERWSGSGCCRWLLPVLFLGSGRVDTAVGGWVSVLWGRWDVLTALGGSGSLPITDPEPDAARKKYARSWNSTVWLHIYIWSNIQYGTRISFEATISYEMLR